MRGLVEGIGKREHLDGYGSMFKGRELTSAMSPCVVVVEESEGKARGWEQPRTEPTFQVNGSLHHQPRPASNHDLSRCVGSSE